MLAASVRGILTFDDILVTKDVGKGIHGTQGLSVEEEVDLALTALTDAIRDTGR